MKSPVSNPSFLAKPFHFKVSTTILFFYILIFSKIYFENQEKYEFLFKSNESLKFHVKYSKKLHHLRDSQIRQWETKNNPENFLFSIISEFSKNKKNITVYKFFLKSSFILT